MLVFGDTFEEELATLTEVFARMRKAGLKLNPKKCTLFKSEIPFLGHVFGREVVRTDPLKVTAVEGWPVPQNVSELRSFLGLCTYYRRFVAGFATIAAPLHHLTRKGAAFEWTEGYQHAFVALKRELVEAPVLPHPQLGLPYIVDTGANQEGKRVWEPCCHSFMMGRSMSWATIVPSLTRRKETTASHGRNWQQ
ncbi:uncharacterized protein LOC143028852 [Oratosquilla oratoria]|uniref:uncharacterized protein LOC143028852 n=1 Tax=Oratosquilla oratoria TaxID=337810 RepID=UPI003F76575E